MCGLAGIFDPSRQQDQSTLQDTVIRMGRSLVHRGPDDRDHWVDVADGIGLAHQRLAIVDLSSSGRQPMHSACGRYVLVFNGEIYNHGELRAELTAAGIPFRGHSDTETLLAAIAHWGLLDTLERLNGMFALAIWDRREKCLSLARDRLGIKPLYYGWLGKQFVFGSELKALVAHPDFNAPINRTAICSLLQHSYVAAPLSIYEGIAKLRPGHWLAVDARRGSNDIASTPYWSVPEVVAHGASQPFTGTPTEAVEQLDQLLADAVSVRQMSDVPLGAFLSGGIDSSTVVALMQRQLQRPVRTFAIGFDEPQYNEAGYASRVAEHLGTDHTELIVSPEQARDVIPLLPALYDEPFADSSQIPTFLVSQLARQHVTVALSGDGGDELFGGYQRYALTERLWQTIGWLHPRLRAGLAPLVSGTSRILPFQNRFARKLRTLAGLMGSASGRHLYHHTHTHWKAAELPVLGGGLPETSFYQCQDWARGSALTAELMAIDLETYLPDDILTKVDRASMGVGLEARVPLLDHRVVEFAWTLPMDFKIRPGESKWILRQVLDRYVPRSLIDRPKVGFGVPLDTWLRGPLRDWAENLLSESTLRDGGFFAVKPIRDKWQQHQQGTQDWHYYLWDILMFQAWYESQRG